jgi:hypothetical protein
MLGASSGTLGVVESGRRPAELAPYFESGSLRPLPISRSYGLDEGQVAYAAVAGGTAGRIVIRPCPNTPTLQPSPPPIVPIARSVDPSS